MIERISISVDQLSKKLLKKLLRHRTSKGELMTRSLLIRKLIIEEAAREGLSK